MSIWSNSAEMSWIRKPLVGRKLAVRYWKRSGAIFWRFLPPHLPPVVSNQTFASKHSTVRFDTNDYSVPVRWAHHPVQVKGFVDRVEIWTCQQCVAIHLRLYGRHQYVLDPFHYIPLLE